MREGLLLDAPHRKVVFTIPKMLRLFFRFRRSLLSSLCLTAIKALLKYFKFLMFSLYSLAHFLLI